MDVLDAKVFGLSGGESNLRKALGETRRMRYRDDI
jgi:hypothetical protein